MRLPPWAYAPASRITCLARGPGCSPSSGVGELYEACRLAMVAYPKLRWDGLVRVGSDDCHGFVHLVVLELVGMRLEVHVPSIGVGESA